MNSSTESKTVIADNKSSISSAIIAAMPLSIAVLPWGVLCGTLSIEAGLTNVQAQLMSLLVFAGAAQISGIAILGASGSWVTLLNSTAMISVRHVLYSATYKEHIAPLPWLKRVLFAFLLTDEMFVIAQSKQLRTGRFDYWYAVIAGFSFYVVWNLATFAGIFFAQTLQDIDKMGFDFAIAATFIAMVVPLLKNEGKDIALYTAVLVSALMALVFEHYAIKQGLMFSALIGMAFGAGLSLFLQKDGQKITEQIDAELTETENQKNQSTTGD